MIVNNPDLYLYNNYDPNDPNDPSMNFDENGNDKWLDFEGDGLTDEAFNEAQFLALNSPVMKKNDMDKIENITVQIFAHLYSITDQDQREEFKIVPDASSPSLSPPLENSKFTRSNSLNPSARDTNFYEESSLNQPLHIPNVVSDILSSVAYLFFGWDPLNQKNKQTPKEMKDNLYKDRIFWDDLGKHYSVYFQGKMQKVFNKAEKLLENRIKSQQWAFIQRLTLYATLIIAAIGKLSGQNAVLILGLSASAVTFLSMITHYGADSFKQAQQGADLRQSIALADNLKASIDRAYKIAFQHRLDDPASPE